MVAGHMDEVGFMVTTITKEGYVKFTPAGGWWSQVMLAQQMVITTCDDTEIRGVIGAKAPHILTVEERAKPVAMEKMYLDLGVENKEEAVKLGIKPGDMITPYIEFQKLSNPKYYLGKAWDNRVGCAATIDVLRSIQNRKHENIYYGVGTVQEEVGLRGASTAANMIKPDVFIAIDCSPCADSFDGDEISGKIGGGFLVRFIDPSAIMHRGMKKFITETADKNKIKYQYYQSKGGTDAARVQLAQSGVLVATIGMPARYIHSTTSMISIEDYAEVKKIVYTIVKMFNEKTVQEIRNNV